MPSHLDRARLLLEQERYDLSEAELHQAAIQNPDDAQVHALLAIASVHQDGQNKKRAALYEAQMAVHLAPEWAWAHYVLAFVQRDTSKMREAETAVRESLRLNAENPDAWGLLASIHFAHSRWRDVLDAAERGLTVAPDHIGCANLRAMALTKLKQPDAARAALESALVKDPENALTHANRGWGLLESGKSQEAMASFQQALRLDPEMEWAKRGIVEALQARNPVYRVMLSYFFWMGRLSPRARWGVVIGLYFGAQIASSVRHSVPALAPFLLPVSLAYALFVYFSYTARPIFNLLLRLHPLGRLALSREQIAGANAVGACLGVAALSIPLAFLTGLFAFLLLGFCAALFALPVSGIWTANQGTRRKLLIAFCAGLGTLALAAFAQTTFSQKADIGLFSAFLLCVFGYTWVGPWFQGK